VPPTPVRPIFCRRRLRLESHGIRRKRYAAAAGISREAAGREHFGDAREGEPSVVARAALAPSSTLRKERFSQVGWIRYCDGASRDGRRR
jgi:hypothetical protein